jgi:hypothetical protein
VYACYRNEGNEAKAIKCVYLGTELPLTYIRIETFFKKPIGRNDIEDTLQKLDKLEQGELRSVTAQVLKTTTNLKGIADDLKDGTWLGHLIDVTS